MVFQVAVAQNEPVDAPSLYLLLSRSKCHEISVQSLDKVKQRIEMEVGVDMDPKKFKQVMDSIYNSQLGNCFQPDPSFLIGP
jgi:hypothetical protein